MATGYKPLGKVKTVVLPVPRTIMTIEEYKETYGIDVRDFLEVREGYHSIYFKDSTAGTLFLVSDINAETFPLLGVPNDMVSQEHDEGSDAAILTLSYDNPNLGIGYGISFTIGKDDPMDINNISIGFVEF